MLDSVVIRLLNIDNVVIDANCVSCPKSINYYFNQIKNESILQIEDVMLHSKDTRYPWLELLKVYKYFIRYSNYKNKYYVYIDINIHNTFNTLSVRIYKPGVKEPIHNIRYGTSSNLIILNKYNIR